MTKFGAGLAVALFATLAFAQDGAWRNLAAPDDVARVEARDEAFAKAMGEAQAGGSPEDLRALETAMGGGGEAISPSAIMGEWRCRTIKMGGLVPLIVYDRFRCRFSMKNGQVFFEKLSGSQRVSGYVYDDGARMILLGALSVGNEPQGSYAGAGESAGGEVAESNQIGIVVRSGSGRMRIEFPYPYYESTFDVLELTR